ncbi:MAG: 4Fe-4S ferredoxin N-terminal domain-containing protein [Natrialbaceae archaeon]|nr:4Fe-4S ferredoxin N-terminal domain-containing protein [Natrialbaceae archaeon]
MSADDDSFHPMGEEWEAEMEAMLDDTEYDTELGMDIAEDSQRLVAGEMTEQEFHEKYHDAIVAEFGMDDRPNAEEFEDKGLIDSLKKLEGDGDVDRREVMKKMGAGAAFLGLGGLATKDARNEQVGDPYGQEYEDRDTQWGWSSTSSAVMAVSPV